MPPTLVAFPIPFLQPIVKKSVKLINNYKKIRKRRKTPITESLFYILRAVVFYCHACGLSL